MDLASDAEFKRFLDDRRHLLGELDELRAELDQRLDEFQRAGQTMMQLASFSGLLAKRRDLLNELAELDDRLLQYLLVAQQRG